VKAKPGKGGRVRTRSFWVAFPSLDEQDSVVNCSHRNFDVIVSLAALHWMHQISLLLFLLLDHERSAARGRANDRTGSRAGQGLHISQPQKTATVARILAEGGAARDYFYGLAAEIKVEDYPMDFIAHRDLDVIGLELRRIWATQGIQNLSIAGSSDRTVFGVSVWPNAEAKAVSMKAQIKMFFNGQPHVEV
jgi:hypothetical protein